MLPIPATNFWSISRALSLILRPSSLAMKCFLLGWRRIERIPLTSTCLMRLPTTSFSRSRRSVSTSGSSGTGAHLLGLVRGALARRGERAPRHLGGGLLGLLLRASLSGPTLLVAQVDGGVDALGVVGAFLLHDVAGQRVEALGGELLQAGL